MKVIYLLSFILCEKTHRFFTRFLSQLFHFTSQLSKHAILSSKIVLFNQGWERTCNDYSESNADINMDHCIPELCITEIVILAPLNNAQG